MSTHITRLRTAARRRRPSASMIVALVALVMSCTGVAIAAVNGSTLVNRSVAGGKLKLNTVTGVEVNESKLATVPRARRATSATTALTATSARTATTATSATTATTATTATSATTATTANSATTASSATTATTATTADNAMQLGGIAASGWVQGEGWMQSFRLKANTGESPNFAIDNAGTVTLLCSAGAPAQSTIQYTNGTGITSGRPLVAEYADASNPSIGSLAPIVDGGTVTLLAETADDRVAYGTAQIPFSSLDGIWIDTFLHNAPASAAACDATIRVYRPYMTID